MMKKTRILSLIFVLVFSVSALASFSSCKESENEEVVANVEYEKSGYSLVKDNATDYVILLPAKPTQNELLAAEELNYFMQESTTACFSVVYENSYVVSSDAAIISIGNTAYADSKNIKTDGTLDDSGYIMKTVNNQLFIRSDGDGQGCIYGVYDLLETSIGYRYYYVDEIYYEEKDTVDLYKYDIVADPSFDFRAMSTWNAFLRSHEDYLRRTRTSNYNGLWAWGGNVHTQTSKILPTEEWLTKYKYGTVDENGEPNHWFSKTGDQICWTAGDEMCMEAAKDIVEQIQKEPFSEYFMVGQADVTAFCTCPRCEEAKKTWALNDAGLQINFINSVAGYVNEWIAENCPERNIRLVIFAYYGTEEPPVKMGDDGKWVPYNEKVKLTEDNVDIYFAPIYTDYSVSLTGVENEKIYSNLLKWMDFLEGKENEFLLYTYDTNFHHYMYNFNNFDTFKEQAKQYSDLGVDYIHSQGATITNQPCFQEMRYFVESQILWDTSKNYNELVNEFMTHFYKDASAEIREYYDFTRMRYEQVSLINDISYCNDIYSNIGDKEIWTEGVVDAIDKIFIRAYQKIAHYKTDDPKMYEKLFNRIKELELTNIYSKLKFYAANYTQSEKNALVDEFNYYALKFDINRVSEFGDAAVGYFDNLKR